jgi:hypothetical protein
MHTCIHTSRHTRMGTLWHVCGKTCSHTNIHTYLRSACTLTCVHLIVHTCTCTYTCDLELSHMHTSAFIRSLSSPFCFCFCCWWSHQLTTPAALHRLLHSCITWVSQLLRVTSCFHFIISFMICISPYHHHSLSPHHFTS